MPCSRPDVRFAELGLVIIDEQHRFGVHQRMALREKGAGDGRLPHQLIMTATPIPRSLAMAVYADLDLSVIDELPPGRTPITTVAVPDSRRDEVIERVRNACAAGRQAYWVCTLVEESEALQAQAAEDAAADSARAPRGCASAWCTAASRPPSASRSWPPSPPASWTCWWPPRSSRSAWTCPTPA
jgi:ATP-dependent DNA helicase RecG